MSTSGLAGILSWHQARSVAAQAGRPLAAVNARLDEAAGARLAQPIITLQDTPAFDAAAMDGFALCGEGPWSVRDDDGGPLRGGDAQRLLRDDPLPEHTDCVLSRDLAHVERQADGQLTVIALDPLSMIPDERVRPDLGVGIIRQGARGFAGDVVVESDAVVAHSTLALAASLGHDYLSVLRTPVVGTLVLGGHLLDRGLPRPGRERDALGHAIPAFVGALGARGNPAVRAPDSIELLLQEIDDAQVDVLVTTGSTALTPDNHLRQVLRDLDARWLVDGVAVSPGAQMLLARLSDGRFLVGLPGQPQAALAAAMTLLPPLIAALRDAPEESLATAVLLDDAPLAEYADDTVLVPVTLTTTRAGTAVTPVRANGLAAWAASDVIAVVPPGAGRRGEVVELLPHPF